MAEQLQAERERFVAEGIHRFARASETLSTFKTLLTQRLEGVLSGRRDWGAFAPDRSSKATLKPIVKDAPEEGWIVARRRGSFRGTPVVLAVASWWDPWIDEPPACGVIFYSQFYDADGRHELPLEVSNLSERVRPAYEPTSMLYLVPDERPDIDRDFGLLLDQLLACKLARARESARHGQRLVRE